ncbi:hypothetical protein [Larkinella sp.]|uniref:hypothetical protein n=1 Tax=Larkinella sp. TaxID=2034517 RepID=UPI003BAB4C31
MAEKESQTCQPQNGWTLLEKVEKRGTPRHSMRPRQRSSPGLGLAENRRQGGVSCSIIPNVTNINESVTKTNIKKKLKKARKKIKIRLSGPAECFFLLLHFIN